MKNRLRLVLWVCFSLWLGAHVSATASIKTPAEVAHFARYTQHEDLTRFLVRLDHLAEQLSVQIIGKTEETQEFPSRDLYGCILTEDGGDPLSSLNRKKPTVLLVASQHGNEQSAKEAVLQVIRDLTLGDLNPLLENINVLVIPQANPYGNWFDTRRNEQDLDLNRDHVKMESPGVKAIHKFFQNWMPEVTMDIHEKGDDYYRVSIGCVSNPNIHPTIQDFSRKTILRDVARSLGKKNIPFHEYLVTQRMGIDSSAGVRYRPGEQGSEERMKRFSTTDLNDGRNSLGIYETFSFIQEGASRHDLETLKQRTLWQVHGIVAFLESIARHGSEIVEMIRKFRKDLIAKARSYTDDDVVHLRMRYARDSEQPTLKIKTFERTETPILGILKRDKKAGDPVAREEIEAYPYPSELKVVEQEVINWFPLVEPMLSVPRPLGYIVPSPHQATIDTLLDHGVKVDIFTEDTVVAVEAYRITHCVPAVYDYLPPQEIEVEKLHLENLVKKGDYFISCAQEGAHLIPCLLEPQSQYGLIRYWKFNLVPEPGDVFPVYRYVSGEELPVLPYKNWKRMW
ncbi:MAG: M14 family zinc carboxypeptidase [Candidatus Aminicenantales bacterium]